jgi:glutathione peroxidase
MSFRVRPLLLLACGALLYGAPSAFDFVPLAIDGTPAPLATYRGKVLLIVNVASHSILTPQYEGLEWLYQTYEKQGLVVLAFPANNFGQEEPGTNEEIRQLAAQKYKVTFPLFAKISAAGEDMAPLYQFLTGKDSNPSTGGVLRWSFTKFLIGRDGKVLARFEPNVDPRTPDLLSAIEKALNTGSAPKPGAEQTENSAAAR